MWKSWKSKFSTWNYFRKNYFSWLQRIAKRLVYSTPSFGGFYPELVESIEDLELSTKELFSIIGRRENEIINDGLFEKLINFHKNQQAMKEWTVTEDEYFPYNFFSDQL